MPTDIGIIDLGMGFPYQSVEEKKAAYDFFRPLLRDRQSRDQFEFPAEYMFKDAPDVIRPTRTRSRGRSPRWTSSGSTRPWSACRATASGPSGSIPAGSTSCAASIRTRGPTRCAISPRRRTSTASSPRCASRRGTDPQVAIDDKKMYPIYTRCVELGMPICINGGIVGPRMPSWPQHVERFDNVLYDFPELTMVMMHGGEPWTALAVKLMVKWPGLHYMTSAFAPKHYPADIIRYANTRGADKIMFCGYFPAGLTLERQMSELPDVGVPRRRLAQVPADERDPRLPTRRPERLRSIRERAPDRPWPCPPTSGSSTR